jgi:RNA-binding protein
MALTAKQRKYLKALAHPRKAVVQVGNAGVTDAVLKETARALERHELIKVRLPAVERAARAEMTRKLCEGTEAEAVQEIGRVAALYRRAQKPRLIFPE